MKPIVVGNVSFSSKKYKEFLGLNTQEKVKFMYENTSPKSMRVATRLVSEFEASIKDKKVDYEHISSTNEKEAGSVSAEAGRDSGRSDTDKPETPKTGEGSGTKAGGKASRK